MPIVSQNQEYAASLNDSTFYKLGKVVNPSRNEDVPIWSYPAEIIWPETSLPIMVTIESPADAGKLVYIQGLDDNYHVVSETIQLDPFGRHTEKSMMRINKMCLLSEEVNQGYITATHPRGVLAYIDAGDGELHQVQGTIPCPYAMLMSELILSYDGSKRAEFKIWERKYGESFDLHGVYYISGGTKPIPYVPYTKLNPRSDHYMTVKVPDPTSKVSVEIKGYYRKTSESGHAL